MLPAGTMAVPPERSVLVVAAGAVVASTAAGHIGAVGSSQVGNLCRATRSLVPSVGSQPPFTNQDPATCTPQWPGECQDVLGKTKTQKSLFQQVQDTRPLAATGPSPSPSLAPESYLLGDPALNNPHQFSHKQLVILGGLIMRYYHHSIDLQFTNSISPGYFGLTYKYTGGPTSQPRWSYPLNHVMAHDMTTCRTSGGFIFLPLLLDLAACHWL